MKATMNLAEHLNLSCACRTLDAQRLHQSLPTSLADSHPHLFSETVVFISTPTRDAIAQAVAALTRITGLPGYQQAVAVRAQGTDALAPDFGPSGVFMGYDFHLAADGPRLIEINTNAGGALLNAALADAHTPCSAAMDQGLGRTDLAQAFIDMFRAEWQSQRGAQPWRTAVVIDDDPQQQYLAPEFELARRLFERHGIQAVVADPRELEWRDGALWHPAFPAGRPIDLAYNRLTDFTLSEPSHAALRHAYRAGAVVLTPHPRAHAMQADKRNLVWLGDDAQMARWGGSEADRAVLRAVVPVAQTVQPANADALWRDRRQWFFKPMAGYGGKAAYRGDKLTRKSWAHITAGGFVAQALVPPSERVVAIDGVPTRLKMDVRAYAYRGRILLLAARTYAGQTTNLRTPGGGFAPVLVLPPDNLAGANDAPFTLHKRLA
ncbi:MAG: hypothetical protein LCH73_04160 [Proteobacteria bacterium]|nr:hypothetical protein [Pseudomonadota bacterium]